MATTGGVERIVDRRCGCSVQWSGVRLFSAIKPRRRVLGKVRMT
jgi:hypothetical protein